MEELRQQFDIGNGCDLITISKGLVVRRNIPCEIPNLPPYGFEYICVGETICYDFEAFDCLESFEVESSSRKLIADIDGTEICISSIFHKQEVVTLSVTPIGYCGNGVTQEWTIYVNDPEHCGGGFD